MSEKTDLMTFEFESAAVRTVVDEDGAPLWVGKDVCACLGIANHKDALAGLDEDERKGVGITDPLGKNPQVMVAVNESGLYALIFKSRKAVAKRFRKWVTAEVLPAIRRAGGYRADADAPDRRGNFTGFERKYIETMEARIADQIRLYRMLFEQKTHEYKAVRLLIENTALSDDEIAGKVGIAETHYVTYVRKHLEYEAALAG